MILMICLTAAAWLIPNHYAPWSSAWSDGVAITGLLFALFAVVARGVSDTRISLRLVAIAVLCCIVISAQLATGKLLYTGDAWMAIFYLMLWLSAVFIGSFLTNPLSHQSDTLDVLIIAWLFSAFLSVGIALVQWTGAFSLGIYGVEMPVGGRPYGNVAQPNHLCTLLFLGLCAILWLHQKNKVNGIAFILGVAFLLFGMAMTQSRTGWLQIGLLLAWTLAMQTRAGLRIRRIQLLGIGFSFFIAVNIWPMLCDALLLPAGRSIIEQIQPGSRFKYWWSMLDAIIREPIWGYGWQQIGAAQQRVSLDHPDIGEMFEHSHNLALDLILWNGVLVGTLIIMIFIWWILTHIRACRDARVVWLLLSIGGILVHGMLEFPLEYAYFLIPIGFAMGGVDSFSPKGRGKSLHFPRWAIFISTLVITVGFLATVTEYLKVEENYRSFRMESARIGVKNIQTPAPDLILLSQLNAFLNFSRTDATIEMDEQQLEFMKNVSERFGYPPVLFRYALATGLNGKPLIARDTLGKICRIHTTQRCIEAREGWISLQSKYPQLIEIKFPD